MNSSPEAMDTSPDGSNDSNHTDDGTEGFTCPDCRANFTHSKNFQTHRANGHCSSDYSSRSRKERSAFGGICGEKTTTYSGFIGDASSYFRKIKEEVYNDLRKRLLRKPFRCTLGIQVEFSRRISEVETQFMESWFISTLTPILNEQDMVEFFKGAVAQILSNIEAFVCKGSSWVVYAVSQHKLNVMDYTPLSGSSYIPTPDTLKKCKTITNIKNSCEKCFLLCVLAALNPAKSDKTRAAPYLKHEKDVNLDGIRFPMTIAQIPKFEGQNNMKFNIFIFTKKSTLQIVYQSKCEDDRPFINLLLLTEKHKSHYVLINNLSCLIRFLNKKSNTVHYVCERCLHKFRTKESYKNHRRICKPSDGSKVELPSKPNHKLQFEKFSNKLSVPFAIFADFEAFADPNTTKANTEKTTVLTNHIPSGFSYVVVNCKGKAIRHNTYVDTEGYGNVTELFLKCLIDEERKILPLLKENAKMIFNAEDAAKFNQTDVCHICGQKIDPNESVHRDHSHIDTRQHSKGTFRGKSHAKCNLRYRDSTFLPILFHNFSYDGNLLLPEFGKVGPKRKISCIARSLENFISIQWGNIRFLDSFAFLSTSLENLGKSLAGDEPTPEKFPILYEHFGENYKLFCRKGVFPYDFLDSHKRFADTTLPSKDKFFNTLTQEDITDSDYQHAKNVWEACHCKNMADFQGLYNLADVLLLADVFEAFRSESIQAYELDPLHNYTLPGLSWDACLKSTGVQLDLITDYDMLKFIQDGIRGGVSMISHRLATANNKYLSNYNQDEPTSYICYWDCNNLYGSGMQMRLPQADLEWIDPDTIKLESMNANENIGYFLEVDLTYDDRLHDAHSDLPLAPEHLIITEDILSPYSKALRQALALTENNMSKLTPNLRDKEKYVVHSELLEFYMKQGLRVTKIHRVVKFKQSAWLKSYIDLNTEKRKLAKSTFQKDFFKLLNNSIYGKCIENQFKRCKVEIITSKAMMKKMLSDTSVEDFHIFHENLVLVRRKPNKIKIDRPLYVGMAVLELSKLIMYQFHYEFILPKYGDKAKLCFTDTDSLTYHIMTEDLYRDMYDHRELFDTSDYPKSHFLYSEENKKKLGKFKDECNGTPIRQFVGLKPKCYSISVDNGYDKKTAKGVSRTALKTIPHETYLSTLENKEIHQAPMYFIRNVNHSMSTIRLQKTTLNSYDDKRYVLEDGINTLAHFHFKTRPPIESNESDSDMECD